MKVNIVDPLRLFFIIFIGLIIGVAIICYAKVSSRYWLSAFIITASILVVYVLIEMLDTKTVDPTKTGGLLATTSTSAKSPGNITVQPDTFPDSTMNFYGTEIPIMGPLDGLQPVDIVTRLNYLYDKTSYPYRPMKYTDYQTDTDNTLKQQGTSMLKGSQLETKAIRSEMSRWYPDTTLLQVNARDCTNYSPGSPLSCVIDNNAQAKKQEEGFQNMNSVPKSLDLSNQMMSLFKNAPGDATFDKEELSPSSPVFCRNCKVGKCRRAVCGSRFFEPGNDNLIDPVNYVKEYLDDGAPTHPDYVPLPTALRLARG